MTSKWMIRVGLALVVVGGWQVVKVHLREDGALRAEMQATQERYAALEERGIVYDTTFVHDTVRFAKSHARYDSLVNKLPDSLKNAPPIKEIVQAADSTIRACSVALDTCEHRVAIRDSLIGNLKQQLGLEKKRRPGLFAQLGQKVIWAGIGFGAAKVLSR